MRIVVSLLLVMFVGCNESAPEPVETGSASVQTQAPPVQFQEGKVVGVVDGDTIDILTDKKKQVRLRLNGIDAPERGQPFGNNAKKHLSDLVMSKRVRFEATDTDRYGRTIAKVVVDGKSVTHSLVEAGLAWHYTGTFRLPYLL